MRPSSNPPLLCPLVSSCRRSTYARTNDLLSLLSAESREDLTLAAAAVVVVLVEVAVAAVVVVVLLLLLLLLLAPPWPFPLRKMWLSKLPLLLQQKLTMPSWQAVAMFALCCFSSPCSHP